MKVRWMNFLEEDNLILEKQFGFRKGRSCMTSLISFYSRVIDEVQERDGWVDCIYLDLKKHLIKYHTRDCYGNWNMWEKLKAGC